MSSADPRVPGREAGADPGGSRGVEIGAPRGVEVRCEGLGYAYSEHGVLHGLAMEALPGEIVGLIGPNGSGKSTLIRILSGVLRDYTGSAKVDGTEVREHPRRDLARLVAAVPQETPASLPFSVLETVLMGRHPHLAGVAFEAPADVRLAMEGLERSGAAHLADRGLGELSSGERQRVVFARALAQQPRALLLDEPTSFLDIRYQVELYDLVRALAKGEGVTVLTALHDLNLAAEYCDRIFLLREGAVHASGATDEVLSYQNLTEAFQTDVYVDTNDLTGKLVVIPLSDRARSLVGGDLSAEATN